MATLPGTYFSFGFIFWNNIFDLCGGRILASILSAKLLKYFRIMSILIVASFLCGFGIVMASIVQSVVGVMGLILAISMAALIEPLIMGYLHHHADNEARATIESMLSFVERMISMVLGLFFGFVATKYGIITGFWLIGAFVLVITFIFTLAYCSKRFLTIN